MTNQITIKQTPIEEAVKVTKTIVEFDALFEKGYFENRYKDKEKLIIVAYIDNQPAGYIVGYDKYSDGSFYCWMAGVNPEYRKKGVLKALMDYLDNWARQKGYKKIKIKTRNTQREMLSYLVKYNFLFTEIDKRPVAKDNRVLLEKEL